MPYNGPVYHAHEQDRRGDFYMRGAEGFTQGVTSGLEAVAGKMEEAKKARTERDFISGQMEALMPLIQQLPDGPEILAKFNTGGLSQQRGIFTGLQARLAEQEKAAIQQRDDNRWNIARRSLVDRGVPVLPVKAAWPELGAGFLGAAFLAGACLGAAFLAGAAFFAAGL